MKRTTDSPAWRHMQMLASLTSKDGNKPLIKGFFDNIEPPTKAEIDAMKKQAERMDLVTMAKASGVARFMSDDPFEVLMDGRFKTSFNLDGLWGGNMYAGGAGAILPNKITSKHNFRYVPQHERARHRQEAAGAARRERLQGRRSEADRRRAVVARILARHRHLARARQGGGDDGGPRSRRRRWTPRSAGAPDVGDADQSQPAGTRTRLPIRPAAIGRRICSPTAKSARRSAPCRCRWAWAAGAAAAADAPTRRTSSTRSNRSARAAGSRTRRRTPRPRSTSTRRSRRQPEVQGRSEVDR